MRLIHDYYIVKIDKRYEDTSRSGNIITVNTSTFRDTQDAPEQRDDAHYRHKRLYGTIVSTPLSFTDERVDFIDPGLPPPNVYVSHDTIMSMKRQGLKTVPKYSPSTLDKYERITRMDYAEMMDIQHGDKVYFSYMVTEPENQLDDKGLLYKVLLTDIYCAVRRKRSRVDGRYRTEIVMQGGWILAEPNMETWQDIKTPSGIYKKPQPEAKYLEATVRHVRKRDGLKPKDQIFYEIASNVPIEVEGKTYFCMREDEVMCLI